MYMYIENVKIDTSTLMYHYWYSSAICILVKGLIILIAIPEQVSLHMSQVEHHLGVFPLPLDGR